MKILHDKIRAAVDNTLRKNNLFPETAKLLVAYSGGADSTCLAHVLHSIGYNTSLAHANFQLRGKESDEDAHFAADFARQLDLIYHEKAFETFTYHQRLKLSIQEAARHLRYGWFEELRVAYKYDAILTAHHADDQAETMLFNFIRGAGVSGIRGIPQVNQHIIRPLLDITKKEILDYLSKNNLSFREDSSNSTTHYSRNFIRHEIFPLIDKLQPNITDTLLRSQRIYSETEKWIRFSAQSMIQPLYSKHGVVHKLEMKEARYWPGIHTAIYEWMYPLGFNPEICSAIADAIVQGRNNCTFLCEQYEAMTYRQELHWVDREVLLNIENMHIELQSNRNYALPGMNVTYTSENVPCVNHMLWRDYIPNDQNLILRSWKSGDRFQPLGMGGKSKKVSDFLNDIGWSPLQKKCCWLLCNEKTVVLIPCLRSSIHQQDETQVNIGNWVFEYV